MAGNFCLFLVLTSTDVVQILVGALAGQTPTEEKIEGHGQNRDGGHGSERDVNKFSKTTSCQAFS